jgi:hypothetical protein
VAGFLLGFENMRTKLMVIILLISEGCINVNTKSSRFYDSPPEAFFVDAVKLTISDNAGGLHEGKYAQKKSFLAATAAVRAFGDSRYFKTVVTQGEFTFHAKLKVTWHAGSFSLVEGSSKTVFFLFPYKSDYPITVSVVITDKLGQEVATSIQHGNVRRITAWVLTPLGIFFFKKDKADEELIYRLTRKALIDCRKSLNLIHLIT